MAAARHFFSPRLPLALQWLKSNQVDAGSALVSFLFGKAANLRACGRAPAGRRLGPGVSHRDRSALAVHRLGQPTQLFLQISTFHSKTHLTPAVPAVYYPPAY